MTRPIVIDWEKEEKSKQKELEKIKHARELMQKGKLRESGALLYELIKESYGEPCVRNWTFRHYAWLNENTPTELGEVVKEFLECRKEKQAWWS